MKFFTYGSLKQGEFNHTRYGFNQVATYMGPAFTHDIEILQVANYNYPHAAKQEVKAPSQGELYEIDLNTREGLRTYQLIHNMETSAGYTLQWINAVDENGQVVEAGVFVAEGWKLSGLVRLGANVVQSWAGEKQEAA